jgi:hypothetical protein
MALSSFFTVVFHEDLKMFARKYSVGIKKNLHLCIVYLFYIYTICQFTQILCRGPPHPPPSPSTNTTSTVYGQNLFSFKSKFLLLQNVSKVFFSGVFYSLGASF